MTQDIGYLDQDIGYLAQYIGYLAQDIGYLAQDIGYLVQNIGYLAQDIVRYKVLKMGNIIKKKKKNTLPFDVFDHILRYTNYKSFLGIIIASKKLYGRYMLDPVLMINIIYGRALWYEDIYLYPDTTNPWLGSSTKPNPFAKLTILHTLIWIAKINELHKQKKLVCVAKMSELINLPQIIYLMSRKDLDKYFRDYGKEIFSMFACWAGKYGKVMLIDVTNAIGLSIDSIGNSFTYVGPRFLDNYDVWFMPK